MSSSKLCKISGKTVTCLNGLHLTPYKGMQNGSFICP